MFFIPRAPFGLDISDLSIKIISFKKKSFSIKKEFFELAAYGKISIPDNYFEKGEIKNIDGIAELIKKLIKNPAKGKIKNPCVISVLPETKTFIKLIETSGAENETILEIVQREINKDIPLSLDESYLDWQIISRDSKTNIMKILVSIAPKKIVDSYILLLKKAGLKPLAFEIESVAIARSLINLKTLNNSQPFAIIDLGAIRSSIIIFDEGAIHSTSTVSVSGQEITYAIASKLDIPFAKAEKIKLVCGLEGDKEMKTIKSIIQPQMEKIAKRVEEVINFYQNQSNKKIEKILLCGGVANLKGLENFLSAKLKIKTEKGNPWINTAFKRNPITSSESLEYTTAIGLALRGILNKN